MDTFPYDTTPAYLLRDRDATYGDSFRQRVRGMDVKPYDGTMVVEFFPAGERVRMVVTLSPVHEKEFSQMQKEGFTS